ncbi:MAG: tetratricopeptide repeat protein [Pirellulaceae bacterium]
MLRYTLTVPLAAVFALFLLASPSRAENEGQDDLDKATDKKVAAESLADLEEVATLCESALKKGLDEANAAFARQLLTASLYEHATRLSSAIFDREPPSPQWPAIRQYALRSLERSLKFDEKQGNVYYLIARLQALPGGDRDKGLKAANQAVRLAGDDNEQLSKSLVLRGNLTDDADRQLADYNQAVLIDPTNTEALRIRGSFHLVREDYDKAADDFAKLLESDASNVNAHHALAEALTNLEKYDEALKHVNKGIEADPKNPLGYTLRARVHLMKEDAKAALEDLDKALQIDPRDMQALLMRARYHFTQDDMAKAKDDVNQLLTVRPGLVQGILLRSAISAQEDRYDDAITDLRGLLRLDPDNVGWRLQLAAYYVASDRPRRAIDVYNEMIDEDPENWMAMRGRGDALLAVGKQAEAIEDFERVLKAEPDNSGTLNNLAWVLATSPDEKLRDGQRSIELAKKACELTEYKAAHILSTLASGYAETGDFENAKKWSKKAVELGEGSDVREQLEKELESYKQGKPWRELQETEEKPDVTEPSGGSLQL